MARTDNCDAGQCQRARIATDPQDGWRIVDLEKLAWVLFIFRGDERAARFGGAVGLLFSCCEAATLEDELRGLRGKTGSLELGKRGFEDALRTAKLTHGASNACWAHQRFKLEGHPAQPGSLLCIQ